MRVVITLCVLIGLAYGQGPSVSVTAAASPGPTAASPGPTAASPGPTAASPGPTAASPGPTAASPGPTAASPGPTADPADQCNCDCGGMDDLSRKDMQDVAAEGLMKVAEDIGRLLKRIKKNKPACDKKDRQVIKEDLKCKWDQKSQQEAKEDIKADDTLSEEQKEAKIKQGNIQNFAADCVLAARLLSEKMGDANPCQNFPDREARDAMRKQQKRQEKKANAMPGSNAPSGASPNPQAG